MNRVSARDYPDSLLKALLRPGASFWDDFDRVAVDAFSRDRWAQLSEADLRDTVHEEERRRLGALCSVYVADRLREMGVRMLDTPTVQAALPRIVDEIVRASGPTSPPVTIDRDPTTLFDLETLRLRRPLAATVTEFGGAVPKESMLVVRRAEVLRRQYALRKDSLPPGRESVVTLRRRVGEEVMLERIASPDAVPQVGLASIALTCARDPIWRSHWQEAFERVGNVSILIDTPFSQSLDALLTGTKGFRYAIEPLLDGTPLWAYVCAVDGFPPLVLPCTMTRAAAMVVHTRKRAGGLGPVELPAVVIEPAAVLDVVHRIAAEESVIEHHL